MHNKNVCHLSDLLVVQVCLGAHLCQGHQGVRHNQERGFQLWQMMTGWFQVGQEVPEALVDQEDPERKSCIYFFQHCEFK